MVANHSSRIGNKHLLDTLLELDVSVSKIFSPEHGFRGDEDGGLKIDNQKDPKTGVPIISLYGSKRKPAPEDLQGLDIMIFDIQDVGARFYTYISTMHNVMEACAEQNIPLIILDRPNPNGYYVDGPILEPEHRSFVGMHEVPIVHGMTIGEYAQMVNGEKWMADEVQCDLTVIPCLEYDHNMTYDLPVKPSPNLPNHLSVLLYPSLCLFEGTSLSMGRGTDLQFQILGHPDYEGDFSFTPVSKPGATSPKYEGILCKGVDLSGLSPVTVRSWRKLNLQYLINFYLALDKSNFFKEKRFARLAGTDNLRKQIIAGKTPDQIRESWQPGLDEFKKIRKKYLIYKDFE